MTSTGVDRTLAPGSPRRKTPLAGRRISRPRTLPGGRAVVGALLIAGAAVLVFAAYLDATSEPSTRYLVANDAIPAGTVIADVATAESLFSSAPLALIDTVAQRAVAAEDVESLVGQTIVATLDRGDLVQRSVLLDGQRVSGAHVMSFAVGAADAVAGSLSPGETIDVVATSGGRGEPSTGYVVRGVPVLAVDAGSGGSNVILTVALDDVEQVQALGHAVKTADVFVVSTLATTDDDTLPPPYSGSRPAAVDNDVEVEDAEVEGDDG
jgi:hypothetical protein